METKFDISACSFRVSQLTVLFVTYTKFAWLANRKRLTRWIIWVYDFGVHMRIDSSDGLASSHDRCIDICRRTCMCQLRDSRIWRARNRDLPQPKVTGLVSVMPYTTVCSRRPSLPGLTSASISAIGTVEPLKF